jgi:hypothetical protein
MAHARGWMWRGSEIHFLGRSPLRERSKDRQTIVPDRLMVELQSATLEWCGKLKLNEHLPDCQSLPLTRFAEHGALARNMLPRSWAEVKLPQAYYQRAGAHTLALGRLNQSQERSSPYTPTSCQERNTFVNLQYMPRS